MAMRLSSTEGQTSRIVSDKKVMLGKPVIKGTRITVDHIVREMAAGATIDDLLEAHPHITREDIQAALEFMADSIAKERVYYFGS